MTGAEQILNGHDQESVEMSLKIAIVGAGYMAREHAKAFASIPGTRIVGVCGRARDRAETLAAAYDVPLFDSVKAMYDATEADVVVVAVNELSAREICLQAFRHSWLCFLEKPVGIDLPQAEEIMAAASRANVTAYVGLNRRSYSSTRLALRELSLDEGPRLISVLDQQDMASARDGGQPELVVRNYMYANSLHLIDYFNLFGRGEIVQVSPTQPWNADRPGHVVATVQYSSGDVGVYQAVWDGPGPWSVTVTNPAIRTEMRPLERLSVQRRGQRALSEIPVDAVDAEFKPGLRYQAEQVVAALQGQSATLATLEEATRSMALCADIYGLRPRHGA